jgi:serine/threonine-protein kinase
MSIESRRLGKYELRERLASGGQGEVWKAFDERLRRFVAIKQLNAHLQADPGSIARFEREAQFIAALRHPNIVQIHDFQLIREQDSDTSTAYMVMDYIEGSTLAEYIRATSRKKQFPPASDVVAIFTAVSLALDYAHQKGTVHRDIKPANIMLDKRQTKGKPMGEPILMDFGIAKLQGGSETTKVLGTPLYVSPEQALGQSGDKRSDLYSLGIILYEVMAGTLPFRSETIIAILRQHAEDDPPAPERFNPAISPDLSAIILKSIAKDPDARFSSASAMTIALAEALNVPVPPKLWEAAARPFIVNDPDASNLLSLPAGMTPTVLMPPPSQPSTIASPLAFAPPVDGQPTVVAPSSDRGSAIYAPQPSGKRPKKRLYITLIVLLAVLGLGFASYALLAPRGGGGTSVSGAVVGQVLFRSSQNEGGVLDVVEIASLRGIPNDIPDRKSYYAWLGNHDFNNTDSVHWPFAVQNGSISPSSYKLQKLPTTPPFLFLITRQAENEAVPSFDFADRLYYARITQLDNSHSTFDIMQCQQNNDSSNPCRF